MAYISNTLLMYGDSGVKVDYLLHRLDGLSQDEIDALLDPSKRKAED